MIVGSGLVARSFARHADLLRGHCVYAAGVSNSNCKDPSEFVRDRERLRQTLACVDPAIRVVYVSTCSILDSTDNPSMYVAQKIAMENLVLGERQSSLVLRFPQLAGDTPNPHTLLNYLFARIIRSERFELWSLAKRNIIDAEHAADIAVAWLASGVDVGRIVAIANPSSHTMGEIVTSLESISGRAAIFDVVQKGSAYAIDTTAVTPWIRESKVCFGPDYLDRTVEKYFGHLSAKWTPRPE
jgi:uncharacterized protein YbjT (DUF2867 family)